MKKETKDKHFVKKPYYVGGNDALKKFINENLKYPKKAMEKGTEGTVILRYEINHKGKVVGAKIISPLSKACNDEAIRVVKLLEFQVPKTRKARLTFHKTIQIHFRKPKEQPKKVAPVEQQVQYQITPSKKVESPSEQPLPKPSSGGYSYTIKIG